MLTLIGLEIAVSEVFRDVAIQDPLIDPLIFLIFLIFLEHRVLAFSFLLCVVILRTLRYYQECVPRYILSEMAQPALNHVLTGEELLNLGDIGPCELIDGRIIPLPPTGGEHGTIEGNIAYLLNAYVRSRSLGWVLTGEVGIYTRRGPDHVRAADVAFVSKNQVSVIPSGFLDTPPELVVEIVSPSDRWQDLRDKIDEYFLVGVHTLWIVEPKTRTIMVHSSPATATKYNETQNIATSETLRGLEIAVSEVFRDVAIQDLTP